jgi:hypothetical protein
MPQPDRDRKGWTRQNAQVIELPSSRYQLLLARRAYVPLQQIGNGTMPFRVPGWGDRMEDYLHDRIEQLAEQARGRGINWQERMGPLPQDDPRVVLAALATLLELDVLDVLDERRTLEEAEERARSMAGSAAALERQAQAGQPEPTTEV